jgi:hypothetical protein
MSSANFSYVRLELPRQDDNGMITSKRSEAVITAALMPDTQLRQMLAFAHTLNEALDGLATEIAHLAGIEPDSEQITDAVYNAGDLDAALTILCPHMSRERQQ